MASLYKPIAYALLILCLQLLSSAVAWAEDVECRDSWSALIPKGLHKYNYVSEAIRTQNGNIGYSSWYTRTQRQKCVKDWTVLIYMAADNDLAPYAFADIYEMEAGFKAPGLAGSTLKMDVVVEADVPHSAPKRLHIFESPTPYNQKIKLTDFRQSWSFARVDSPIVKIIDAQGDHRSHGERLGEFLNWGVQNYPAKQYMVVVWGHGQGWRALPQEGFYDRLSLTGRLESETPSLLMPFVSQQRRFEGLVFADSEQTFLGIPELKGVLSDVRRKSLRGKKFDLYVSDACLMQQVEVAYELSEQAHFIVGSAQVQNYLGLPYRRVFYEINKGRFALSPEKKKQFNNEAWLIANMIPAVFAQSMDPYRGLQGRIDPQGYRSFSISALNSQALAGDLVPSLYELGGALNTYVAGDVFRKRQLKALFADVPSFAPAMKDLGVFLLQLERLLEVEDLIGGVHSPDAGELLRSVDLARRALSETVIQKALGQKFASKIAGEDFEAVSMWMPSRRDLYESRRSEFQASRFFKNGAPLNSWQSLLEQIALIDE